jgi:hypothetical protein
MLSDPNDDSRVHRKRLRVRRAPAIALALLGKLSDRSQLRVTHSPAGLLHPAIW